jgi:hypothetical protein
LLNRQEIEFFKDLIDIKEITQINLRYINNLGYWSSIAYNIEEFDIFANLAHINIDENIVLGGLSKNRYFIDPFLPHKTLVFLLNRNFYNIGISANLILEYYLNDKMLDENHGDNYNYLYLSKPFDKGADIRNEIVNALQSMDINVFCHYHNKNPNGHILTIKNAKDDLINCDNIQKVKYAILMMCNVYNVELDINKGIFVNYK